MSLKCFLRLFCTVNVLCACHSGEKVSLAPASKAVSKVEVKVTPEIKQEAPPKPENKLAMLEPTKAKESFDGPKQDVLPRKEVDLRISGEVSAVRNSMLAFRAVGFLTQVNVKPGSFVKKGDVLANLDDRDFTLRLALAKARREQAKIAMDTAKREFKREEQLKKDNASTASVYDKMKASYEQSALSFKLAELDVAVADLALKDTRLEAPYDCVIASQMKHEGEHMAAGAVIFQVYDTSTPEITLSVPENYLHTLSVGSSLLISIPSSSYNGKGEIIRLVPVISPKTRTFEITVRLIDYNAKIIPGSYVEAKL